MSPSLFSFCDADVILRSDVAHGEGESSSSGSVDFHVHRCVLSVASTFFEGLLSLPQPSSEDLSKLPVVPFAEPSDVLDILLRYTYPVPDPSIESLDQLAPALEAARKYDMTSAVDGLRRRLVAPEFLTASPLRVYAIASKYELDEEAKMASTATLSVGLHTLPLHEDLKAMDAYSYHRLLLLHEERARAAGALLELPEDVRCMLCNGRRETVDAPPKWWLDYKGRAREELRVRPTSAVICSHSFLLQSAQASGCERCAGSILASYWFFDQLRRRIDALPATI